MRLLTNANQSALGAASSAHARKRLARRPLETTARHTPGHKLGKQTNSFKQGKRKLCFRHLSPPPPYTAAAARSRQTAALCCALEACCTGGPPSDLPFAPSCCVTSPWACRCSF